MLMSNNVYPAYMSGCMITCVRAFLHAHADIHARVLAYMHMIVNSFGTTLINTTGKTTAPVDWSNWSRRLTKPSTMDHCIPAMGKG